MSFDSFVITVFGVLFLANLALQQLIKLAKSVRELHSALKGAEPSPPPRLLNQTDGKRELDSGSQ